MPDPLYRHYARKDLFAAAKSQPNLTTSFRPNHSLELRADSAAVTLIRYEPASVLIAIDLGDAPQRNLSLVDMFSDAA